MLGLDALLNVGGKLIDKLIPDPEAKARATAELAKMAQDGELARMANDTKLFEITNANTADARDMQKTNKSRMPAFLSIITVVGFFSLLLGSAFGVLTLTGSDIMMMLLGVLARETASVYNFWLGSSNSSQQKDILKGKQ
jgi:hypothetical protein